MVAQWSAEDPWGRYTLVYKDFPNWLAMTLVTNLTSNPNREHDQYYAIPTANQKLPCNQCIITDRMSESD